jgi:hypothetical protein
VASTIYQYNKIYQYNNTIKDHYFIIVILFISSTDTHAYIYIYIPVISIFKSLATFLTAGVARNYASDIYIYIYIYIYMYALLNVYHIIYQISMYIPFISIFKSLATFLTAGVASTIYQYNKIYQYNNTIKYHYFIIVILFISSTDTHAYIYIYIPMILIFKSLATFLTAGVARNYASEIYIYIYIYMYALLNVYHIIYQISMYIPVILTFKSLATFLTAGVASTVSELNNIEYNY